MSSEYRMSSPDIVVNGKVNGISNANSENGLNGSASGSLNGVIRKDTSLKHTHVNGFGVAGNSKTYEVTEQINGFNKTSNGDASHSSSEPNRPHGGQGSPLRSQLGLKLKPHKPVSRKPSPLQCLLCPYTTENPSVLEEHINRSHFDPLSPGIPNRSNQDTLTAFQCPICTLAFDTSSDLELHVNIEHKEILSPAKIDMDTNGASGYNRDHSGSVCPVCGLSFAKMKTNEMEEHIDKHFAKSPQAVSYEAQKAREQKEFEMLRAQYGMDDQGNFREQSAAAMQRAVYAGEMSVEAYYERQVGLKAAESYGIDDGSSCTKTVAARVLSLSNAAVGVTKTYVCSGVDHYASSYGDKGWGCGYRNLQMLLSSLLQNTLYNEALYKAWGNHGPARTAMPSISRLQRMVEAAWAQGFDVQGRDQLGKLYNTRKWIGATEIVTVLSWLRIDSQLVDFHRPTSIDGRHPELFNWVLHYFEEPRNHTPPLYLQHQGHSRTIIGIEQRPSGLTLLVLDPSHGPRQVAALGTNQESLRLIRRGPAAMRAPQYQIVAVRGLIETEEQYQAKKVLKSLRIPPDR
uniref:Zinc finger-containing ubiquitin peptidase 1 n=1 Tax=Culicoides sonorensis TaxID=179676 RepID=A0A336LS84_CULSO